MSSTSVCPGDCRCLRYCVPACPADKTCWAGWADYPKIGACLLYDAQSGTYRIPGDGRLVTTCDECNQQTPELCVTSSSGKNYCVGECRP